jgi:hypothetical protein
MQMKSYIQFCFFLVFVNTSFGQYQHYYQDYYTNIDQYSIAIFPSDFEKQFKDNDDKKNFKKLREFLSEKQLLYNSLTFSRTRTYSETSTIPYYEGLINQINSAIGNADDNAKIKILTSILYGYSDSSNFSSEINIPVKDIKAVREKYQNKLNQIKNDVAKGNRLDTNINIVKEDIRLSQKQLDSTLAPEYKQQEFRVTISICFTVLIGTLLVVFFFIVFKKSDNSLSKDLLSGYGLQFVTLFVLIIAIILFGILSILESSELAAILSGISGYILGKGTQREVTAIATSSSPIQNTSTTG